MILDFDPLNKPQHDSITHPQITNKWQSNSLNPDLSNHNIYVWVIEKKSIYVEIKKL